jgi:endonuclease G
MGFSSCKNKDEPIVDLKIALNRTDLSYERTRITLSIQTDPLNKPWTATLEQEGDWCSLAQTNGTTSFTEIIISEENYTDEHRTAKVIVTAGDFTRELSFRQRTNKRFPDPVPYAFELPRVKDSNWYVQHLFYAMEYDTAQRHSVWVAYVLNSALLQSVTSRSDEWAYDPKIPHEFQWAWPYVPSFGTRFPTIPGYDRGHLIPSADRLHSREANVETFYASNMSPQIGIGFNQGIWATLEGKVRSWAISSDCDTMYIVTGGAINPGVATLGKVSSRNNITIPKYYYKALVKRKRNSSGDDTFTGIAFWMENKAHSSGSVNTLHQYLISIRELEEKTGIDFFHNLKYALPSNPNLENNVEENYDITKWPL